MQVSCLDISKDGSLLAMGTTTTIGVPADIYIWDIQQCKLLQTLSLHKVTVTFPALCAALTQLINWTSLPFTCISSHLLHLADRRLFMLHVAHIDMNFCYREEYSLSLLPVAGQ